MNPMPSMAKYTRYITVKPKLLRLHAPYIRKQVATKKNIYAINIGGFGEYHININAAITFDAIPITSQQNLFGFDLKSSLIHSSVDFLPIRAIGTYLFVALHQGNFCGGFSTFFIIVVCEDRHKITFMHETNTDQFSFT